MKKTCNNCGTEKTPATVRLVAVIILLIFLLVGSNIGWLVYESQFQTVETVGEYQIEQDGENGNNNSVINGGEITNGKTNY